MACRLELSAAWREGRVGASPLSAAGWPGLSAVLPQKGPLSAVLPQEGPLFAAWPEEGPLSAAWPAREVRAVRVAC